MPLPRPTLDNRSWEQLVAEGRGLIPRLAPAWTDHNASDPGITLVELFAWLTEQNVYRFDRLSDEAVRRFARLVGVKPLPPQVATTVVALGNGNGTGVELPARMQLHGAAGAAFETTAAVHLSPARLVALGWAGRAGAFNDMTAANAALDAYAPLGSRPRAWSGHALHLGFDRALDAAGALLSLHLWTVHWQDDTATRAALVGERGDWHRHYRARTVWEFHAGGGRWQPLQQVADETRGLSLSGFVRFAAPVGHQAGGVAAWPALFFIRCRLADGGYECAPRLRHAAFNAVPAEHALSRDERALGRAAGQAGARWRLGEQPVVAGSVEVRLDDGATVQRDWAVRLDWDGSGAHDRHVLLVPEEGELVSGNGLRAQTLPAGFTVHARYRIGGGVAGNLPAGTLTALPPTPRNVALAPALAGLALPPSVQQPFEACGGTARETLDALRARAHALASEVDKAVTLQDFERLALATPGVPVARAHAVANLLPQLPCWPAPGLVTVVVVPRCRRPAPVPSRALLERVHAYLEPRRLVTSEVHVIPPRYRRVGVQALLHLDAEVDPAAAVQAARAAVDGFLDPLTGGPEGGGWPIGRPVYRSEVMALLAALPGVLRVTEFGLLVGARAVLAATGSGIGSDAAGRGCSVRQAGGCDAAACHGGDAAPAPSGAGARCDNVELCAHELVRPGHHRLRAQTPVSRDLQRSLPHECKPAR